MQPDHKTPDALIAALAGRRHRVVTRRELLAVGLSRGAIRHRLAVGRLHEHHPGVYSVGTMELDRLGRWLAAVLARGDRAVLSHGSAAELWGLLHRSPGPVHVTVPGTNGGVRSGIHVHATRSLPRDEWSHRHRVPVTTVERTLVDLAADPELERAVEQAFALRLIGRTRMADALARANGKPGSGDLRRILGRLLDDFPLTWSELERRFLRLVADAGLPAPEVNRRRAGHRVDFAWPDHGLVVETDGRATHDNPLRVPPGPRQGPRSRSRRVARHPPLLAAGSGRTGARDRAAGEAAQSGAKSAVKWRSAAACSTMRSPRSSPARSAT